MQARSLLNVRRQGAHPDARHRRADVCRQGHQAGNQRHSAFGGRRPPLPQPPGTRRKGKRYPCPVARNRSGYLANHGTRSAAGENFPQRGDYNLCLLRHMWYVRMRRYNRCKNELAPCL